MEKASIFDKIISFFKEVRLETKKVNWPTRKETIKYTVATLAITIVIAVFLGGLDFIFTTVLNKLIMK
jgi:preprotein translocase subunit SecE